MSKGRSTFWENVRRIATRLTPKQFEEAYLKSGPRTRKAIDTYLSGPRTLQQELAYYRKRLEKRK